MAKRFDHLTFDHNDGISTRGAVDESGKFVTFENATNDRKTIGMNGSGFVEMLARQMTADLQAQRDATPPGHSTPLMSKAVSFGILTHNADGTWNTSKVQGLAAPSLTSKGTTPPSLIIRPLLSDRVGSRIVSQSETDPLQKSGSLSVSPVCP